MSSDRDFRHESLQDNQSIVNYLNALIEGFSKGEISFKQNSGQIVLNPNGLVQMEIKAQRKTSKSKLSIKFSWKETPFHRDDQQEPLIIDQGGK